MYLNMPVDFRGAVVFPSHALPYQLAFGDDYLRRTRGSRFKHAWDNLQGLVSLDAGPHLRVYGGCTYVFRTLHFWNAMLYRGLEVNGPGKEKDHAQVYWAMPSILERVKWNQMFTSQLGIRLAKNSQESRGISVFWSICRAASRRASFFEVGKAAGTSA